MDDEKSQEIVEHILKEVEFEKSIYDAVAENEDYEVIPIDAYLPGSPGAKDEIGKKALEAQCAKMGHKVIYRISYGNYAVIMTKGGRVIGIEPEDTDGWYC